MRRTILWILVIVGAIVAKGWYDLQPPQPAYRLMMDACAKNGGRHVYAPPVEAAGFFISGDDGCNHLCRRGFSLGYSYIEARADEPILHGYALQPGLYRYSKKPAGHPECEAYYKRYWQLTQAPPPPHETCIAAEPISAVSSRYYVGHVSKTEFLGSAEFDSVHEYIDDMVLTRRLAEIHRYVIRWHGAFLFVFPLENLKVCPESTDEQMLPLKEILISAATSGN